jgi:invasion protein IalB
MPKRTVAAALAAFVLALPAGAQQPKGKQPVPERLGDPSGAWSAYTYKVANGKVCYLVGEPQSKRKGANALVTHNTADKSSNVVSFIAGYNFGEKAEVDLDIDGQKFKLFTEKDTAWARDAETDRKIVDAMVRGKQALVKGQPAKGAATSDTYSLIGFTQVLNEIDKACGVKR